MDEEEEGRENPGQRGNLRNEPVHLKDAEIMYWMEHHKLVKSALILLFPAAVSQSKQNRSHTL